MICSYCLKTDHVRADCPSLKALRYTMKLKWAYDGQKTAEKRLKEDLGEDETKEN